MSGTNSTPPGTPDKKKNFWRLSLSKKTGNRSRSSSLNTHDAQGGSEDVWHIVVAGAQCGKSALVHRFLDNKFLENDDPTIGKFHFPQCFFNFSC